MLEDDIMGAIANVIDSLLSDAVVGIVTWVGTILTIGGLIATYLQSAAARQSADRAQQAVSHLKVQIDTANVAYASAELITFLQMVRFRDFDLGSAFFAPIKRSVRLQSHGDPSRMAETESINRAIGTIEKHLAWARAGDTRYREAHVYRAVDGLMQTVTRWESSLARRQF
jgi:hypothetical protein